MRNTVAPPALIRRTSAQIASREAGSRPVVGSSRNSTSGEWTSALARSSRRFIPPEYVFVRRSAASDRPTSSSSSSVRDRAACPVIPYSPHWSSSSSRPVCTGSSPISCSATPIRRRTSAPCSTTSSPATVALPAVGGSSVHSIRTVVVLPAPFGPRNPNTSPAETVRSMSRTASIPPLNVRRSERAAIAASAASATGPSLRAARSQWFRKSSSTDLRAESGQALTSWRIMTAAARRNSSTGPIPRARSLSSGADGPRPAPGRRGDPGPRG